MADPVRNDDTGPKSIHDVLRALALQRAAGREIDFDAVIEQHGHLGAELETAVAAFRSVDKAARNANSDDADDDDDNAAENQDFGKELLRKHLISYRDFGRIHSGGQGTVYRAIHQQTGREVAIKILTHGPFGSANAAARILREADVIARLKHPQIVNLYESGEVKGVPYLVLEYVDGLEIDDYVILNDLEPQAIARIMIQVCEALDYAHKRGVIHRDIKPSNVLVDSDGQPHILDFGLAKDVVSTGMASISVSGQVVGTLSYASPEHLQPESEVFDVRSDVYSAGVMLHVLLMGGFPYAVDGSYDEVRQNILMHHPTPLRRRAGSDNFDEPLAAVITRDLESIVLKALAKDRGARYQSAADLAADLQRYLDGDLVVARNASRSYVFRKTLYRHRIAFLMVALVLVTALGLAFSFWTLWQKAERERARTNDVTAQTFALLEDTLGKASAEVALLAGGGDVRDGLVETVGERLSEIRKMFPSDSQWAHITAMLDARLADMDAAIGDFADARASYKNAIEYWEREAEDPKQNGKARLTLARLYRQQSATAENPLSDLTKSEEILDAMRADGLMGDDFLAEYRMTMAETIERLNVQSRFSEAVQKAEKAFEAMPDDTPSYETLSEAALLARLYAARGRALFEMSDKEAITPIGKALDLRDAIFEKAPTDVRNRSALVDSEIQLGDVLRQDEKSAEALEAYGRAYKHCDFLILADPSSVEHQKQKFLVLDRLATVLANSGDFEQAQAHVEKAQAMTADLLRRNPNESQWNRLCAFTDRLAANVALSQNDLEIARAYSLEALVRFQELVDRDPGNVSDRQYLSIMYSFLGVVEGKARNLEDSYAYRVDALNIRIALAEEQPAVTKWQLGIIEAELYFVVWYLKNPTVDDLRLAKLWLDDAGNRIRAIEESDAALSRQKDVGEIKRRYSMRLSSYEKLRQKILESQE